MREKKRIIENFEVIHSLQIGAREVVVGVSSDQEFMCCFCTQDDIAEYYSEAMSSTDYLEIMELYADRLKGQIAAAQAQRRTRSNSRGTSVYGVNVFTGRRAGRWERGDILGEVRPECLPQWAKDHLRTIERKQRLEKKRGSR